MTRKLQFAAVTEAASIFLDPGTKIFKYIEISRRDHAQFG